MHMWRAWPYLGAGAVSPAVSKRRHSHMGTDTERLVRFLVEKWRSSFLSSPIFMNKLKIKVFN